ncbi:MAG TPA: glycosyltransferase family 39 protein [Terriglobales bacterium]|nr:glycosyltransferase family 39 protein [Terriglobales bacterium]
MAACLFVAQALRFLPVTGENMYPESAGVLSALNWAHGIPLYQDYRLPPHLVTSFPPLWYAFLAIPVKFGLPDMDSLTLFGRILSLIFLVGTVALTYAWNRRIGFSLPTALVSPAFYLSFPILIPWAVTARPDFPALFFSFFAIYWAATRSRPAWICLAGIAASLAFLIRHNAVAAPIAIVLWLLSSRKWKHSLLFCAVWLLTVAGTLVPIHMSTDGLLLLNLSGAKFGFLAVTYVRDVWQRLLSTEGYGFALMLFAFGAFGFVESCKKADQRTRLLTLYLVVSLGLAVVGSAAAGGGVNHYLEPALAMAALVPFALSRLQKDWNKESPLASFAIVFSLIFLLPSLDVRRWEFMHNRPENLKDVVPLVQGKEVFTDIPYLAARTPTPESIDLASLINAERVGGWAGWSSKNLAQSLRARKYDVVILSRPVEKTAVPDGRYPRAPRFDSDIRAAIWDNYRFCFELGTVELDKTYVYGPTSPGPSATAATCPSWENAASKRLSTESPRAAN